MSFQQFIAKNFKFRMAAHIYTAIRLLFCVDIQFFYSHLTTTRLYGRMKLSSIQSNIATLQNFLLHKMLQP